MTADAMLKFGPLFLDRAFRCFDRNRLAGLGLSLLAIFPISPLFGQLTNSDSTPKLEQSNLAADLNQRLAETEALLKEAEPPGALLPGETEQDRLERRVLLSQLAQSYTGHLSALIEIDSAKARLNQLRNESKSWQGFPHGPPYSLLQADAVRETIKAQDLKIQAASATKQLIASASEQTRNRLKSNETNIRRFTEALESATDPANKAKLKVALDLETLRSKFASAELGSLEAQADVADVEQTEANERRDFANTQLAVTAGQTVFTKADLDRVTAQIEKEIDELEIRFGAVSAAESSRRVDLERAEAALEAARRTTPPPSDLQVLQEVVALRTDQLETERVRMELRRTTIQGYRQAQYVYQYRYILSNAKDLPGVREASLKLDESIKHLTSLGSYLNALTDLTRGQITEQDSRLRALPIDSPLVPLIEQRLASLRERLDAINQVIDNVGRLNRLIARWSESVADSQHHLSFLDRLQLAFRNAQNLFGRLWNFELYNALDTIEVNGQKITGRRSVTVGKVIQVVLILVIGYLLCRLLASLVERIAARRFRVPAQTAHILSKWMLGVFLSILIFFSLILVRIPF